MEILFQPNMISTGTAAMKNSSAAAPSLGFQQQMNAALGAPKSLESIFQQAAKRYQVPENLLKAVAKVESNFQADAVSSCGATGIMQLMPSTAKGLGVTDPTDPEQNIMGGAKYLSQMLKRYNGDQKLALAAYNAGSGNVAKYGGVPPCRDTGLCEKSASGSWRGSSSAESNGCFFVSFVGVVPSEWKFVGSKYVYV